MGQKTRNGPLNRTSTSVLRTSLILSPILAATARGKNLAKVLSRLLAHRAGVVVEPAQARFRLVWWRWLRVRLKPARRDKAFDAEKAAVHV